MNGKSFNTTVYIDNKGLVRNKYSKTNLWLSERKEYSPSLKPPKCFKSILGKICLVICWDIFDHKLFEAAVKQGAEWIIIISLWSVNQSEDLAKERGEAKNKHHRFYDKKIIDALVQARSNEYNIGILFCNFGKIHKYTGRYNTIQRAISAGHTQIAIPLSHPKRLNSRKEEILIYDVPEIKQYINDFEIFYGRREDIKNSYP